MSGQQSGIHLSLKEMVALRQRIFDLTPDMRNLSRGSGQSPRLSAFRGRGMEFDEVRAYQLGDDARNIDWRVTARRGEPYTKLFREERERPVFILADLHAGMYFGSRRVFKSVLAAEVAAMTAWAAETAGDRIGGLIAGNQRHDELPPQGREQGVLRLLHSLELRQPASPGALRRGQLDTLLTRLLHIVHPGSLIVILSDFLQMSDQIASRISALRQHNDLRIGFIADPLEAEPPRCGMLEAGAPGLCKRIDTGDRKSRQQWRELFRRRYETVEAICRRSRSPLVRFDTANDPLPSLRKLL